MNTRLNSSLIKTTVRPSWFQYTVAVLRPRRVSVETFLFFLFISAHHRACAIVFPAFSQSASPCLASPFSAWLPLCNYLLSFSLPSCFFFSNWNCCWTPHLLAVWKGKNGGKIHLNDVSFAVLIATKVNVYQTRYWVRKLGDAFFSPLISCGMCFIHWKHTKKQLRLKTSNVMIIYFIM